MIPSAPMRVLLTELDRRCKNDSWIWCMLAGVCQLLFVVNGFGENKRDALQMDWRLKEHPTWKAPNPFFGAKRPIQTRQALLQKAVD